MHAEPGVVEDFTEVSQKLLFGTSLTLTANQECYCHHFLPRIGK